MRARLACAIVLAALTGAPGALAASPSPYDSATTLTVSPRVLPDRGVLSLSGFSDCAVVDGHLLFTRYDGSADNVVVRAKQATRYDAAREKYPYSVRIPVPPRARPGAARVYAEPFCGPPEEYPPSSQVSVRVARSALALSASPRRPAAGGRVRVRAATCDGPGGRLTLQVVLGGRSVRGSAPIRADGTADTTLALPPGAGTATVSAPAAARECPGSTAPRALAVPVRGASSPTSALPASAAAPESPTPTGSPTVVAAPLADSPTVGPTGLAGSRRTGTEVGLAVLAAGALLVASLGLVLARRRRTG